MPITLLSLLSMDALHAARKKSNTFSAFSTVASFHKIDTAKAGGSSPEAETNI